MGKLTDQQLPAGKCEAGKKADTGGAAKSFQLLCHCDFLSVVVRVAMLLGLAAEVHLDAAFDLSLAVFAEAPAQPGTFQGALQAVQQKLKQTAEDRSWILMGDHITSFHCGRRDRPRRGRRVAPVRALGSKPVRV